MAKPYLRLKARKMRTDGESVKEIARELKVSKSTVSLWVRDIILSVEQLERLKKRQMVGAEKGRLCNALLQKRKRLKLIEDGKRQGIEKLGNLSEKEFFVAGIALYWAEGNKKTRKVRFCNSDPRLINFMIEWLKKSFRIRTEDLVADVGINEIHRPREKAVKKYWSEVTDIPIARFRKTSFKKSKNKKIYANYNEHYGTLNVEVLRPARFYYKIMGFIEGLTEAR